MHMQIFDKLKPMRGLGNVNKEKKNEIVKACGSDPCGSQAE